MAGKTAQQSTLSFIINSGPQDQLTFQQELELGKRIQAGLKCQRMDRYAELYAQSIGIGLSEDERKEMESLAFEFGESFNLDDWTHCRGEWSEEEVAKREEIMKDGQEAKNDLVLHNIKLVVFVAKRYEGYRMELAELVQEGMIGCFRAAEKYDPGRGFKFSTCAVPWINQEINRFVQQHRKCIRLPAHVVEGISKINKIIEQYAQDHDGEEPTDEQIAELSGDKLSLDNVRLYRASAGSIASLNAIVGDEEDTEMGELIEDENELSPSEYTAQNELHSLLMKYISELPEVQQQILIMRYALDGSNHEYTLEEIGDKIGFTRERIRQLESEALLTIRVRAQKRGDLEAFTHS